MTRTLNPLTNRYEYDPIPVAPRTNPTLLQRIQELEQKLELLLKKCNS